MARGQPEVMHLPADSLLTEPLTVGERLDLRWVQREEIVNIEDTKFVSITKHYLVEIASDLDLFLI